ncbi:hypothetical protein EVJ58_g10730 [Rhodofomes roseus]|uniref:Uncharacterized protein n=1 Tax=Rhodofomes roseus TaxID=34475 RepID=A0A4Y9XP25_9APHY|nr:hypothetical protein EVJ58_g10730 [Rhodofomes roseus]
MRSAITWSGFDNFYYLFTHEDSRDQFDDPYDMKVIQAVFRTPAEGESSEARERRELYNRKNEFFEATSFAELLEDVTDAHDKDRLGRKTDEMRMTYANLMDEQRKNKIGFALE